MMDERKLNFNQPLLSVRRGASMGAQPEINSRKAHDSNSSFPPLPYYKSDLKSGPVRNPGVVPFQWEQMPGRPKDENKVPKDDYWQLAVAPKLPPGRIPRALDMSSVTKGILDNEESEKDTKDEYTCSSDDENVTFVDAPDALSRTESFFNCSVSGVDDPSMVDSGMYMDPRARDFMMGRFLPASKAVSSETIQYFSRKHSEARQELKPVKRVTKWKQQALQATLPSNVDGEKEDEREDNGEYVGMDDMSASLCGLLPKFCILNPVPGMRHHTREISSVRSVRTRPSYAESCKQTEKKDKTNSHIGNMKRVIHPKTDPLMNEHICGWNIKPPEDGAHHLFVDKEKRSWSVPRERKEGMSIQGVHQTTILADLDAEKTIHVVGSEPTQNSRDSTSGSSDSRERNPSVDSLQDMMKEEQTILSKSSDIVDSRILSSTWEKTFFQDAGKDLKKHQDYFNVASVRESGLVALGPLLPKSPSESWLSRTLPTMSTKKPFPKYVGNLPSRSSPLRRSDLQHKVFRHATGLGPILEN